MYEQGPLRALLWESEALWVGGRDSKILCFQPSSKVEKKEKERGTPITFYIVFINFLIFSPITPTPGFSTFFKIPVPSLHVPSSLNEISQSISHSTSPNHNSSRHHANSNERVVAPSMEVSVFDEGRKGSELCQFIIFL